VRDADQLEVVLRRATLDDSGQRVRQAGLIGLVEVRGGLVQRQHAAVETKGLRQSEANHNRCEHLLACRAATAHVQRNITYHTKNEKKGLLKIPIEAYNDWNERMFTSPHHHAATIRTTLKNKITFAHDHSVIIGASGLGGGRAFLLAGLDLNAVDVLALVDQLP